MKVCAVVLELVDVLEEIEDDEADGLSTRGGESDASVVNCSSAMGSEAVDDCLELCTVDGSRSALLWCTSGAALVAV